MESKAARDAILASRPPASDYLTYLTIIESHLSPAILPTLHEILQDVTLSQNIGWDLIHLLLPLSGSEECLTTIARLGNPREVVLKVTEALQTLQWQEDEQDDDAESKEEGVSEDGKSPEPSTTEQYCTLVRLLAILLPRIKTKYPSRFLSTSLMALLANYSPSEQATLTLISFIRGMTGSKRPPLPGRKSSTHIQQVVANNSTSEPDPEEQTAPDPQESAIQKKLLQSFTTHVLEEYINVNTLEWSMRLREHYSPDKILSNKNIGKVSIGESFKLKPELESRDTVVGQLVALARDLGLTDFEILFHSIENSHQEISDRIDESEHPNSPNDVPLSPRGCLNLIAAYISSSVLFESNVKTPIMTIFPDFARLVKQFLGSTGVPDTLSEGASVIDAILMIGIWLEENNKFVGGPLEDEDFLQLLQTLSLLSANNPSPTLRNAAHDLTTSVLHAHPNDQVRLAFITDTLENCPFEALKASAVAWLKDEIIVASERKSSNCFSSTVAISATQPYLFPDASSLTDASDEELLEELGQSYPFHIAVVNFVAFLAGSTYSHAVPSTMFTVVEHIYLEPLTAAVNKAIELSQKDANEHTGQTVELALLAHRIELSHELIKDK